MFALLAQARPVFWAGWGIGEFVIAIIIVAAIVAVLFIALRQFGITIPAWVIQVFWVLVAAVVCIVAIRFLLSL